MSDNYVARKNSAWLVVSILPDVCKTPIGPSTPPVPYPVIAKLGDAVQVVPSVRANGDPMVVDNDTLVRSDYHRLPNEDTIAVLGTIAR